MASVNEEIQDRQIRHSIFLERYKTQTVFKLIALLNRVDDDIIGQIARRNLTEITEERLNGLLANLRTLNAQAYAAVEDELKAELQEFAKYEASWQASLLAETIVVQVGVTRPDLRSIYAVVNARPFQGRLLKEWSESLEAGRMARIRDQIRIGMVEGQTTDEIVRRVRGTRARNFKDGILDISRRDAATVVRTAVGHTAAVARDEVYSQNSDLLKGIQWSATLDGRTTMPCRVRDNKLYTPDTHKPINHSVPWLAGPGRLHFQCRSVGVPVTKSWRELGIDIDDAPPGTRASMNGQLPEDTSYGDWLKKQPASFQDEVLGRDKGKLFRRGGLEIEKFADRRGNELTLDQLREREPAAFERAGLN